LVKDTTFVECISTLTANLFKKKENSEKGLYS